MVTISVEISRGLDKRLASHRKRLPEIIERGLKQLESETADVNQLASKKRLLEVLQSSGLVQIPEDTPETKNRMRRTPIKAGGQPASEMIIEERRSKL